ncbi:Ribosome-recycling factor [Aliarcobacter thereius]|uniref:Ribosome-recycling factor n=2 Tax=Aliarcobacter thereius TaxID=544718 RepID=A0A1C0BAD1_9BACT|nr:ribosome recycling factor [Aliarcobacter thereius]OCL88324.1 Ribosome-recycling factor [Aliarcobacter thereius]OCL91814.1 Ribosome-recycling factor [Aliarcobacter thereius]OCL95088.1 Ribosome-recycling factor [Aliarcobacter thereius LMG 24486]OCM00540.1 Ribosome-recycling factor [Aliarcobacter thereius]QBF16921.1 ribosome releasing factor [Aliarcobacter thereius LMG 24486]
MLEEIYSQTKEQMEKSIDSLKRDYKTLRTGKVNVNILDNIKVDYYGTMTDLSQVGSVLATDATTITINPWEKNLLGLIEKAIQTANIGVNPNNNGESIKLFFPPMTVEQRQETAKQAKVMTDNAKVAIRNIRQNANTKVKNLLKDKEITEDDNKKAQDEIQKITDGFVAKADETLKAKEKEILTV